MEPSGWCRGAGIPRPDVVVGRLAPGRQGAFPQDLQQRGLEFQRRGRLDSGKAQHVLRPRFRYSQRLGRQAHGRLRGLQRQDVDHRWRPHPGPLPVRRVELGGRKDVDPCQQGAQGAVGTENSPLYCSVSGQNLGHRRPNLAAVRAGERGLLSRYLEHHGRYSLDPNHAEGTVLAGARDDRRQCRLQGPHLDSGRGHLRHAKDSHEKILQRCLEFTGWSTLETAR